MALAIAYLVTPITMLYANVSVPNLTRAHVYFSTDPCVPYQDVDGVIQAMNWCNANLDASSCVILQHHLLSWGQLHLDPSSNIIYYATNDVDTAISKAQEYNFTDVYFVWWNQPIGWNNVPMPSSFAEIKDFGRISVYSYQSV